MVNIPDNIARVNIDQYLKDVQEKRRKGLNYSYNTEDDDEDPPEEEEKQKKTKAAQSPKSQRKKHGPWNEVCASRFVQCPEQLCFLQLKHWHSLFDEGNDRDVYYNTLRTSNTSSNVWTTDNVEQIKVRCLSRRASLSFALKKRIQERQSMPLKEQRKSTSVSPRKKQTMVNSRQKVLLGYDFVAGLLDNERASVLTNENSLSDSYIDELVSFRKKNLDSSTSCALSKYSTSDAERLLIASSDFQ